MCRYVEVEDDVDDDVGGCRVWAGLVPGEQGAASSGPGTGTQYQDPGTPPEAAWEPIVRPSLTGYVGGWGRGFTTGHISVLLCLMVRV